MNPRSRKRTRLVKSKTGTGQRREGTLDQWNEIPHCALGEVPGALSEKNPLLCRQIVAKRAVLAAYGEAEPPRQGIADLFANLRHLCDGLGFDFAELDRSGYRHYLGER